MKLILTILLASCALASAQLLTVAPGTLLAIAANQERRAILAEQRAEEAEQRAEEAECRAAKQEEKPQLQSDYQRMVERVALSNPLLFRRVEQTRRANPVQQSFDFRIIPTGDDMLLCPLTEVGIKWARIHLPHPTGATLFIPHHHILDTLIEIQQVAGLTLTLKENQ
jgi:hypothetical protein